MRYQGGKRRSAKYLAPIIARCSAAAPVRDIGDLFLGSAGIEVACSTLAPVTLGAEICAAVVACYRAVADGWDPPARLTREEWTAIKAAHGPDSQDPIAAFALAFCAYGGIWASARLPDDERHGEHRPTCRYAAAKARKDLLALRPVLQRMTLVCEDYRAAAERVPDGGVLYLDPPWRGTTGYKQAPPFDVDAFWAWAAKASLRWRVVVSEGPLGPPAGDDRWALAWSRVVPNPGLLAGKVECLWYLRGGLLDGTLVAQNAPATPLKFAPPCEDPPTPAEPATGPQETREVATLPTASDSDPWDALPPMMPIAA